MDKQTLERFIAKYNLGGAAESVLIKSDKDGLHTKFITDDKNAMGIISTSKIELEHGEYGIYNTAQFRSLLGVLENTIKVKVVKTKEVPTGFLLSDDNTKATAILAHKDNIPDVPDLKKTPEFELTIKIDEKLLTTFIRAKSALSDAETFTIDSSGKKPSIILGYSSRNNTNRVAMDVDAEVKEEIDPISFSASYFKEILLANKEMTSGQLQVASAGLAKITFAVDGFDVTYYLVMVKRKD